MKKVRHYFGIKEYRYKTKSGIDLVYLPNKKNYSTVVFNINAGSIYKNNESSLYYSNLIPTIIKDNDLFSFLLKSQATFSCSVNYSNTTYQFNSFDKGEDIILYFLSRLNNLLISQENLDSFIKNIRNYSYQTSLILSSHLNDNLFISSPFSYGNVIKESDVILSLESAKKFYFDAYKKENVSIYISGPLTKKEANDFFISLDNKISYFSIKQEIKEIQYNENYSSTKRSFSILQSKYPTSYLSFGYKLPRIDQLLNRFDKFLVPYLYLTKYACFDLNGDFLKTVNNSDANFIETSIDSSGFETSFLLMFEVGKEERLTKFLNEYSLHLSTRVDKYVFSNAKRYAFATLFDNIIHPNTIASSLNYKFCKSLEYTKLLKLIKRAKYDEFISFLTYFQTFPKSTFLLKSSG